MSNKKTLPTKTGSVFFREAVRGTRKIVYTKVPFKPALSQPKHLSQKKILPIKEEENFFSDFEKLDAVSANELIHYAVPGVQPKVLRKLRLGQYAIEARLDLHGKTVEEAKQALVSFLQYCGEKEIRHLLIIHGKGHHYQKPILKNKLNHWLRQTRQVIAFTSAIGKDGSTGALYVLLKRWTSTAKPI